MSEFRFEVGDRVVHTLAQRYFNVSGAGTVKSRDLTERGTPFYWVLYDEKPPFIEGPVNRPAKADEQYLEPEVTEEQIEALFPGAADFEPVEPAGEDLSDKQKYRSYQDSYTKQVVDRLDKTVPRNASDFRAIVDALELLKQYHRDLHLPYEQRDAAQAEVEQLRSELESIRATLVRTQHQLNVWRGTGRRRYQVLRAVQGVIAEELAK